MANYKMEIRFKAGISEKMNKAMTDKIMSLANKRGFRTEYQDFMLTIDGVGRDNDFANMGVVLCALKHTEWFRDNIAYWYFYNSEGWGEDLVMRYHLR